MELFLFLEGRSMMAKVPCIPGKYPNINEHFTSNVPTDKEIAFRAIGSRFSDRLSFDLFYKEIETLGRQDEFHRVTNFYLFLVKCGDWNISVEGFDPIIDYFTNSFKTVALFSLIESLTDLKHQDFYQWLSSNDRTTTFPISCKSDLDRLYGEYKKTFGSIRRCVDFFRRLPVEHKTKLCNSIRIDGVSIDPIENLAKFLYNLRSNFVHAAELVLYVNDSKVFHLKEKGMDTSSLSLKILLEAFEEGLLSYFRNKK